MFHILRFDELSSTNDYAKTHGQELSASDVIWATTQTSGRGRFDRIWQSKKDLTFSILFRKAPLSHTILAPLAVVYALRSKGIESTIKWPNDVLYEGKKCGGILVERIYEGNAFRFEVAGIGLNLDQDIPEDLKDKAIALPEGLESEDVLYHILRMYAMLLRMDKDSILSEYRKNSMLIGKDILVQGKVISVLDVNMDGELMVSQDGETSVLRSEEISLAQIYDGR